MITEERLEKVERELADLRADLAAGFTTRQVTVVDDVGKVCALLANGSVLSQYDERGKAYSWLSVGAEEGPGPGLALFDENGTARAALLVVKDGSELSLHDKNGKTRAWLSVGEAGPSLFLLDAAGKTIWRAP